MSKVDLSTRKVPVFSSSIPSFSARNYHLGHLDASGMIFTPDCACTVQWILAQVQTACTIQLLENDVPIGTAIDLPANAIVRFAGKLLPNNSRLSFALNSPVHSCNFEVAWVKEFCPELIVHETEVFFEGQPVTFPNPLPVADQSSADLLNLANTGGIPVVDTILENLALGTGIPVSGPLTDTQLRATPVPVSGTVTASGPLTDTQLRAVPVPVSGTVTASGPLTDTQLRAVPVPVSGTVTATVPNPLPVSGPLTDTQLRATPVPVSGTVTATVPNPLPINVTQQNGVGLSAPIADAPVGTETAPVIRTIGRKKTTLETTTPLSGNAVFLGPWHDSELDGTIFVVLTSRANQAAAANGLSIDESEDNTDANFTRNMMGVNAAANSTVRTMARIVARYWRVHYINGVTGQSSFKLTSTALSYVPLANGQIGDQGLGSTQGFNPGVWVENPSIPVSNIGASINSQAVENSGAMNTLQSSTGSNLPLMVDNFMYGGLFSGTPDAVRQAWSKARTPTVFRHLQSGAVGPTAIWTPAAGNKFRLLRFRILVTNDASQAAAGVLMISFLDAAGALPIIYHVFVPAAAPPASAGAYDSGWVNLGSFGILSAAANNVLNLTLSAALTAGTVCIIVGGTEE